MLEESTTTIQDRIESCFPVRNSTLFMVIYALPPRKAFGDGAGTRTSFDDGKVCEKD